MRTLPRGHHHLSREEVGAAQRARLLAAMVAVVAEQGYGVATVGAVLKRARISRQTFYEHFANKEECFLAAFDHSADLFIARIEAAFGAVDDPVLVRLERVMDAYLGVLEASPASARVFLIEVYGAGYGAVERRMARQERFAMLVADAIEAGGQWRSGLEPRFIGRTILGAVSALVTARIEADDIAGLTDLRPSISEFVRALLEP
ncbi:DNA-binding transcriptional regulator, AcrR family [Streptacidiphilus jiangxiensis]|uniref:DNA-binding transcriptional regulator, AcrR family n=1 Tax=Streptacidiphilus jiangxiensis TaxID=235985 RepID=A0A1H7UQU2_STRJI|nr:DNA-binding transcriptional regulator, AcrR family [Streptacidiphilus jiangxiensis]